MARTEHYYDPDAPTANSIVVAVTVFVLNDAGEVLLIRRTDNDLWALPGGGQEIGEYVTETAVRETLEETGIRVEVTGMVGVYSNPNHVIAYTDGEVRQQFALCLRARSTGGELQISDESHEVRWIPRDQLDALPIHPSTRLRIDHGYENRALPHIS
jgi:ADP-ribose pyrophosphatase YjhB (NUDIX family)